jgi:hypothetical protein
MMKRTFFCLGCRRKETTDTGKPPLGWLSLAHLVEEGSAWQMIPAFSRLGLFCTLRCLLDRAPVIALEIGESLEPTLCDTETTVGV